MMTINGRYNAGIFNIMVKNIDFSPQDLWLHKCEYHQISSEFLGQPSRLVTC